MLPASPHAHLAVQACTWGMAATTAGKKAVKFIRAGFCTFGRAVIVQQATLLRCQRSYKQEF